MSGVNGARGEVTVDLAGAPHRLCLTLGALAEIETALGVAGLEALADRMRTLSGRDLTAVLAALLRGAGEDDVAVRQATAQLEVKVAAEAVARAFAAAA